MNILKGLFPKKKSSCCNIKIEEVKENIKEKSEDAQETSSCCNK